jgi:uncharacterized protein YciI
LSGWQTLGENQLKLPFGSRNVPSPSRMGARAVDWARLESVCTARYRGFESLPIRTHVSHYGKLLEAGKLALGGPFIEGGAEAGVVVGMMIAVPGVSKDELEVFAADDPAVKAGTLEFEIRQWLVGMKQ